METLLRRGPFFSIWLRGGEDQPEGGPSSIPERSAPFFADGGRGRGGDCEGSFVGGERLLSQATASFYGKKIVAKGENTTYPSAGGPSLYSRGGGEIRELYIRGGKEEEVFPPWPVRFEKGKEVLGR